METPPNGTHASVPATVNLLNLLQNLSRPFGEGQFPLKDKDGRIHRKAEVFDENNENYRADVLNKVYEEAVNGILKKPDQYFEEAASSLEMDYKDGEWKISPNQTLKLALAGGSTSGANLASNVRSEVLGELIYIPKIYTIEEKLRGPKAQSGPE